ncbi:MAG: hypothetical protein A3G47_03425 [Candidatus Zambryskibacteria bacterium RIFCSPLOWO2_12_FULL_39_45]|uniref:LysM domain-containing protein n=1 Tax=Candidatus Zambryskibacteria bacterium RIFCSPHIGHO2_12_FULL_38_37 TaxID=1802751 RepID=A0A1G2TLM4_9BACT|nr:MAG: hypothetical protein A3E32_00890 [Candidatus Zambryskibacteria bacterium RIFCSPHIGHO2_12_FULL_38_37]OHB07492.1 MAG: hypothetical protein A2W64_03875 [Candidatus Zambryskibacteria bacterium RIFCSPLOWO2_02_39_10]OHB14590.1 MAG: hypothetical protein A3G47_03425 [Candidatus Zambryskibacteria bacterium RIFCSPLOWO2_12_FULL_39_45]
MLRKITIGTIAVLIGVLLLGGLLGYFIHGWMNQPVVDTQASLQIANLQGQVAGLTLELEATKQTLAATEALVCKDQMYTVVSGDSLSRIARKEYGNGNFWPYIWDKNKDKIADPNKIAIGLVLTIPCYCMCNLPALPKVPATATVSRVVPPPAPTQAVVAKVAPPAPTPTPTQPVIVQVQPAAPIVIPAPQVTITPPVNNVVVNVPPPTVVIQPPPVAQPVAPVAKPTPTPKIGEVRVPETQFASSSWSGSITNRFQNLPTDRHNWVNYSHADVGYTLGYVGKGATELQVFGAVGGLNARKDTKTLSWDQSMKAELGLRLLRPITSLGSVELGVGMVGELRGSGLGIPLTTKVAPMVYIGSTMSWDRPTIIRPGINLPPVGQKIGSSFPGLLEFRVGNTSPFERKNIIGTFHIEQGVLLMQTKRFALIPELNATLSRDTQKRPWENRYTYGAGIRLAAPVAGGVLSFIPGYECGNQYRGAPVRNASGCGPSGKVEYRIYFGSKNPENQGKNPNR